LAYWAFFSKRSFRYSSNKTAKNAKKVVEGVVIIDIRSEERKEKSLIAVRADSSKV